MTGEIDLNTLIATMRPYLHEQPYVFCSLSREGYQQLPFEPLASFHEAQGITIIIAQNEAIRQDLPCDAAWAWITLTVHSSLSAVGFLAAITTQLAEAGISVNPVSAFYHDHLFVPWESRQRAMDELQKLSLRMGK
jgi:hypothetical protein